MKARVYLIFFALAGCLCISPVLAQTPLPNEVEDNYVETPIDGGLGFLLAAGAVYGLKKYRSRSGSKPPL